MKLRKLFAGVAAAATLLGGMAFGAATANAAETVVSDNAKFTFTATDTKQLTGRTLEAYKLADYVNYGGDSATYGVKTATTVTDVSAIKAALTAAGAEVPNNVTDYMQWALSNGKLDVDQPDANGAWANTSTSRKFVESLKTATDKLGNATEKTLKADQSGKSATVELPAGVYLFLDKDSTGTNVNATPTIAILVASGSIKGGVLTDPTAGATIQLKNQITAVTKLVNGKESTTASVGQTVTYTISSKLPQNTQYYTDYDYTYTDTPSAGQTVNVDSLKVTVDGVKDALTKDTDYTVTANKAGSFTVTIKKAVLDVNNGKAITLTYTAKVTEAEAAGDKAVTNKVVLSDKGAQAEDTTSITNAGFSFTKTDAQGDALQGATFTIAAKDSGATPAEPGSATATSAANGAVSFKGLADGTYTVTETAFPNGYQHTAAAFEVTIAGGKVTNIKGTDIFGLAGNATTDAGYSVKNVKNLSELPKTGAAGIAMFVALGVMLAGAAATVYAKSRRTNAALHA
ncbi:SpaH/EbpB family LPXTG-anchored major pilin [Bifidobacterium callimiconis]|uniref:Gram-positive pilin backbone subunit 2, Cna-B-like domain-containing protein n=1 Tax=Bifidobacterium callimiconis TaxID=2306973 RepID=A0A430FDI0_9BIFI|nr:SpaH/EbpB family LPXTG-anchored major pilin [Bifidobacterium callimiconis]RSX50934.1 Gram-positive pilin backbone subunit 2, Cna-B-like domain-containing protein [Bifidobacterium callimiconis]